MGTSLGHAAPIALLALAAVALVYVEAVCLPEDFNFFPPGKVNRPGAWNESSQRDAGNSVATGELYPIATYGKEAGGPQGETLELNFQPVHPYLGTANLSSGCLPVQSAGRKRLLANSSANTSSITTPATYTYKYSIDGKVIATISNAVPGNNSSLIQINPWALQLPDYKHTLVITVTIKALTGVLDDGSGQTTQVPAIDIEIESKPIVFYFFGTNSRPTAKVTFQSCSPTFNFTFSKMQPEPVGPAWQGAEEPLYLPVYYIHGVYIQSSDGTVAEGDDDTLGNRKSYTAYWVRTPGAPDNFTFSPQGLANGWWNFTVESAIYSPYASLMSLAGVDTFSQVDNVFFSIGPDGSLTAFPLTGKKKFMGHVLPQYNRTRVGIQDGPSELIAFQGPEASLELDQLANFTWTFVGLSQTYCKVDGVLRPSGPNTTTCTSPYSFRVNDNANHTLVVTFADTCGVNRTVTMNFSVPYGWSTDATNIIDTGTGGSLPVPSGSPRPSQAGNSPKNGAVEVSAGNLWILSSLIFSWLMSFLII